MDPIQICRENAAQALRNANGTTNPIIRKAHVLLAAQWLAAAHKDEEARRWKNGGRAMVTDEEVEEVAQALHDECLGPWDGLGEVAKEVYRALALKAINVMRRRGNVTQHGTAASTSG